MVSTNIEQKIREVLNNQNQVCFSDASRMDVNKVFDKVKELGHASSRRDELREFCKQKIDHVTKHLPRRILNSDGGDILDCILNGLVDIPTNKSKVKILDIVLESMRKESTSLTHCGDVISRLCLELPRVPAADLVRWCNDCIQSIVADNDANMIWRDILPESLNALSSYDTIKHCGTDMTIEQYKEQCVHTLCQCLWQEKQLVQLTAMFKDMQLNRNDHKQVVNKICSYIIDIPPDTLPPLVHQLLKLCKTHHVEIVLSHLGHYFSIRLYSKLEPPPQDSESTTMDIDDIVQHSPAELSRCLSTCLYHISQGAAEPELIRKHIKMWPKSQLLRSPFLIDLALALSDKGADFKSVCLDVIRSSIEHRVLDGLKSKESSWVRSVLPPDVDVASVLKVLTTESANHRQLTVVGLINLAYNLLSISRVKTQAPACWSLGKLILVRVSKAQPETANHILTQLADRLATDLQSQYADCLYVLCSLSPVSIERSGSVQTIVSRSQPLRGDYRPAAAVLDALHPLLQFSTATRDCLLMVCRKALYSRDTTHRCLALSGFLTLLRHVKLSRTFSSSQSVCSEQYSAHSYLTQLTVDLHQSHQASQVTSKFRNEAMCMEVVSILRRCLVQDAAVKQLLYTKIYECCKEKPVLHESILELFYEHLIKYLSESENGNGNNLLLDKCVQLTSTSAVLVEPISNLLYAIAQFIQPIEEDLEDILASQSEETGSAYLKSKLNNIMDQLCNDNFATGFMEGDPGLSDLTPESKAKSLKVQQILQCYEALVAHQLMQWNPNSNPTSVYNLCKACNQLLDQTKVPPKTGKKGNKSTLNDTRETAKTQKSQKSQKEKGKGPIKVSNLVKDRAGPFKPLPCVWDLNFCHRILELLYKEEVAWCALEHRNQLRSRRDFHQWVLRCVQSAVAQRCEKRTVRVVVNIAALLYSCFVCKFRDICDFDDQTALCCLEVFKDCLTILFSTNYSLKMESFLPTITGLTDTTASACIADILEKILASLVQIESESVPEERDVVVKKLYASLIHTASLLLEVPVEASAHTNAVLIKLEDYVRSSTQDWISLTPALLAASCREQQEAQLLDDLLIKLAASLARIDEEDTSAGADDSTHFPAIDTRTGHTVLNHVCSHLNMRCKSIEHILQRARDLTNAINYAATAGAEQRIDRELKELYKSLVIQLCQLTRWTSHVCKLRCSVGAGSDRVLTSCVRLYALLAALAKLLAACPERAIAVRFERLLKLSGKKLSTVTDNLITYLEASQQQQNANKVLRDTKLIPRLVLEAEQFSKQVLLLASKAKVNYQQYMSLGTARDFRIKGPVLEEVLNSRRDEEQVDINDAETEILSPRQSDDEAEEQSDEETSRRKRRRV